MRRAIIVLVATGAGLALVLGYHPKPEGSSSSATAPSATSTPAAAASLGSTSGSQTVTGTDEAIGGGRYGDIQVKVSVANGKITAATTAALNTNDPRSAQIEQVAVPQTGAADGERAERQHPGGLRSHLHDTGLRGLVAVGARQAEPELTPPGRSPRARSLAGARAAS